MYDRTYINFIVLKSHYAYIKCTKVQETLQNDLLLKYLKQECHGKRATLATVKKSSKIIGGWATSLGDARQLGIKIGMSKG
jgi:hypothetical protein